MLVRVGQTEASVDIARIAGLQPAAVICEIMNDDSTMARMPDLEIFAEKHGLKIVSVADLVRYRVEKEMLVRRVVETDLPTHYGTFRAVIYEKRALPGGLNTTGVAPYKLFAEDSLREVEFVLGLGAELRLGVEIGVDLSHEQLLADHDAVFVGVGLGADGALGIPGEDGPGVTGATAWIERMKNTPGAGLDGVGRALAWIPEPPPAEDWEAEE